jgi:hypothetical protein
MRGLWIGGWPSFAGTIITYGSPSFAGFAKLGTSDLAGVFIGHIQALEALCYRSLVPNQLRRYYGAGYLHFITTSCHHRQPLLSEGRSPGFVLRRFGRSRDGSGEFGVRGARLCKSSKAWGSLRSPAESRFLLSRFAHASE